MPADIVSPATRSRMMSGIRSKNTKPEQVIRSALHREGFRFRLHRKDLPGHPDLVLPRYKAIVFVHGCFWHGHDCHLFRLPSSRQEFWNEKIGKNRARDQEQHAALLEAGWRIATIWECALKGRTRLPLSEVVTACSFWLKSDKQILEIKGNETRPAR
ncbi:MAG: very short patch repair endonuclease [Thalassospira sp.]|uniref:very short patch repair endonuclease n=1 Tax=Thalassospira sp. UBA4513 TaxID=1947675 RepID=UPI000C5DBC3A|nr:very short patch repair endonuclease [Thalassospira sp. UBA4513]MBE70086.1 very short patch repair endonuclease [Thalassospira sp.]|tara:strand:+ start:79 stop:552 length:474 start_codon:yes stop_codon:yes gene_type:complete